MTIVPWGRIAAGVAILLALWWGINEIHDSIHDKGKAAGLAEGQKDRADLAEKLANAQAQSSTCSATLDRITEDTARGVAEANARAAAGERAAAAAEQEAKEAKARAAKATGALTAAKRVPACKVQLEMELCSSIPLL